MNRLHLLPHLFCLFLTLISVSVAVVPPRSHLFPSSHKKISHTTLHLPQKFKLPIVHHKTFNLQKLLSKTYAKSVSTHVSHIPKPYRNMRTETFKTITNAMSARNVQVRVSSRQAHRIRKRPGFGFGPSSGGGSSGSSSSGSDGGASSGGDSESGSGVGFNDGNEQIGTSSEEESENDSGSRPSLPELGGGSGSGSDDCDEDDSQAACNAACIASESLKHLTRDELVFEQDVLAQVLCDMNESCATPGHMVVYKNEAVMMKTYCKVVGCTRRIKHVNSPRYTQKMTIASKTQDLMFTALAARFETVAEEGVLSIAVRLGI